MYKSLVKGFNVKIVLMSQATDFVTGGNLSASDLTGLLN